MVVPVKLGVMLSFVGEFILNINTMFKQRTPHLKHVHRKVTAIDLFMSMNHMNVRWERAVSSVRFFLMQNFGLGLELAVASDVGMFTGEAFTPRLRQW